MKKVLFKGLLHADPSCRVVNNNWAKASLNQVADEADCICVTLTELMSEDALKRGVEDVFARLESQVAKESIQPSTLFKAAAALTINPQDDPRYAQILKQAKIQASTSASLCKLKRKIVLESLLGRIETYRLYNLKQELGRGLEQLQSPASGLTFDSFVRLPHDLEEKWFLEWAETGSGQKTREEALSSREAWSSGKTAAVEDDAEGDGLRTNGLWVLVFELLQKGAETLVRALDDSEMCVVLLKDWTRFAGKLGSEELWELSAKYPSVTRSDVMALYVPTWAGEYLDSIQKKARDTLTRKESTHLLVLHDAPKNWERTVETMLVLWEEAGGSFKFELDLYGSRRVPESNASYTQAWDSAKALESN